MRKPVRKLKATKPSRKTEVWYRGKLLDLVASLGQLVKDKVVPIIRLNGIGKDALSDDLEEAYKRMAEIGTQIEDWAASITAEFIRRVLSDTDTRLAGSIRSSLGIDITGTFQRSGALQEEMNRAIQANVALIKDIPDKFLEKLKQTITNGVQEGARHESLISDVEDLLGVTESRAELIARDQVGKLNSDFSRVRQTSLGIEEYEWSTSGDERVREEHADLDGQVFRWDSPPDPDGHPGMAINCRCVAIPIFRTEEEEP